MASEYKSRKLRLSTRIWNTDNQLSYFKVKLLVTQAHLTLCNPMDCSPLSSSVHGILQARILEWVAISYSRGSSWLRDQTCISYIGRQILYCSATREASYSKDQEKRLKHYVPKYDHTYPDWWSPEMWSYPLAAWCLQVPSDPWWWLPLTLREKGTEVLVSHPLKMHIHRKCSC